MAKETVEEEAVLIPPGDYVAKPVDVTSYGRVVYEIVDGEYAGERLFGPPYQPLLFNISVKHQEPALDADADWVTPGITKVERT